MERQANFDLWVGKDLIRVLSSPYGETEIANTIKIDEELGPMLDRLRMNVLGREELRKVGSRLFKFIFRERILSMYQMAIRSTLDHKERLRIRLSFGEPEWEELPWEYMYDPESQRFLSLSHGSVVIRYRAMPGPPPLKVDGPLRILLVTASPLGLPLPTIAEEEESIMGGLEHLAEIEVRHSVTRSSLRDALQLERYHVLHFATHGSREGEQGSILLEDKDGHDDWVQANDLASILADAGIRLVVLNASYSSFVADSLLRSGIPAVIGWGHNLSTKDATYFTRIFYSALADGLPLDLALTEARKSLYVASGDDSPGWGGLILSMRTPDTLLFHPPRTVPVTSMPSIRGGDVIYSGGGSVTDLDVVDQVATKGGDFVGRDQVVIHVGEPQIVRRPEAEGEDKTEPSVEPVRLDPAQIQEVLSELEEAIATDTGLSPDQRIQGMVYLEDLDDALSAPILDQELVQDLLIRISKLGPGLARIANSLQRQLNAGNVA